jgi:hypothetical protein
MSADILAITGFQNLPASWYPVLAGRLLAYGWVQTADTGQTASGGYQIWKMADALQATAPVFMKIESTASGNFPELFITIGTGSNGSGTLTGRVSPRLTVLSAGNFATASTGVFSGSTSRFACQIPNTANSACWGVGFAIERSKDSNGNDTGDGVLFISLGTNPQQYYLSMAGTQRSVANTLSALYPFGQTTLNTGNNATAMTIGMVPPLIFDQDGIKNAGINLLIYASADLTYGVTFVANTYGVDHTYFALGTTTSPGGPFLAAATNPGLAIRFE